MIYPQANESIKAIASRYSRFQCAEKAFAKGFYLRANLNPEFVRDVRRWQKEDGKRIGAAIRSGNAKEAARLMHKAVGSKVSVKQIIAEAIYDEERWMYQGNKSFGVLHLSTGRYERFED